MCGHPFFLFLLVGYGRGMRRYSRYVCWTVNCLSKGRPVIALVPPHPWYYKSARTHQARVHYRSPRQETQKRMQLVMTITEQSAAKEGCQQSWAWQRAILSRLDQVRYSVARQKKHGQHRHIRQCVASSNPNPGKTTARVITASFNGLTH